MKLTDLFREGKFVITAEIGPPKGWHIENLIHETETYLRPYVAAINVTDNQSSVMRLGALSVCKVLQDRGINTVYQITCRDRNRLALQSDILSAALFGIENLLLLTGDHTVLGDHPQSKPVFDLDSVSLIQTVKKLEQGEDLAGNPLEGIPPSFAKGAVVSPCSDTVEIQLAKMERKVKAGVDFFQTQAVFEPEKFVTFLDKTKQFKVPIMAGIVILKSVGMAKYMNDHVAGVNVPYDLIDLLKKDKERTRSGERGIEIAATLINQIKPYCQGIHLMTLGWESKVPIILKTAGLTV